jgi:hypothetical protein
MSQAGESGILDMAESTAVPAPPLYATPAGRASALRVVMLLPQRIPGWVGVFLELAAQNEWIDVVVLSTDAVGSTPVPPFPLSLRALLAVERWRGKRGGTSLAPVAVATRRDAVVTIEGTSSSALERLRHKIIGLQPDLILMLGDAFQGQGLEELASCAQWGCWLLDGNLAHPVRAGFPLLGPMLRGEMATPIELELHCPPTSPLLLAGSWGRTRHSAFTVQREQAFLKLAPLLLRALHRLAEGRVPIPEHVVATLRMRPPERPLGMAVGVQALATTLRAATRWRWKRRRTRRTWMLVVRRANALLDVDAPVIGEITSLCAPLGFWADPCAVDHAGRQLLFVEEWTPHTRKGEIACLELEGAGVRRLGLALDEPGHLSFPQPFQWQGDWYLTVESSEARRVSLYRASAFPLQWQRFHDLVIGRVCVDLVLHFHEGRWYLFANVAESGNSTWDELFLFVSENLHGPFRPHPCNPIVSDVRRARLAGRLFTRGGKLIRPAQDCAPGYGAAVVFNEILELDPTHYRERVLSRLGPDWDASLDGCHTYSAAGGIEMLDAHGVAPAAAMTSVRPADVVPAPVSPA